MTPAWRRLLLPLTPIYAAVVQLKRWLYDRGFLKQRHLHHPVVSVGSLSAGGAGKTPVVLLLSELLRQRGVRVRILTRGYGRTGKLTERVDPNGDAERFGDEPLLLARRAPEAAVFVSRDRYRAGVLAEENEPAGVEAVYLLDDGFQHQRLAREIELLLVTKQDFDDKLIPAGNLREPLRSIRRADFLILRADEPDLPGLLQAALPFKLPPTLTIQRRLSLPSEVPLATRPLIFSGLARPQGFVRMLAGLGVSAELVHVFKDHHRYASTDIKTLVAEARSRSANGFITTEKDAVKLTPAMLEELRSIGPVLVATLDVTMLDQASAMHDLLGRLVSPAR